MATAPAASTSTGRSTAGKLLAKLADDGRVERQPGGRQHGRRTADRWMLTAATTQHPAPILRSRPPRPPSRPTQTANHTQDPGGSAPASSETSPWIVWPTARGSRCHPRRSPRCSAGRPAQSATPYGSSRAKARSFRPRPSRAATPSPSATRSRPSARPPERRPSIRAIPSGTASTQSCARSRVAGERVPQRPSRARLRLTPPGANPGRTPRRHLPGVLGRSGSPASPTSRSPPGVRCSSATRPRSRWHPILCGRCGGCQSGRIMAA
jgi:hypothetical protein